MWLAQVLDAYSTAPHHKQAAAELRRLHTENERLHQINQSHEMKLSVRGYEIQIADLEAQRDALLEALKRIESAVDWYLGRSSFTQTTQLKGLGHSASVRKELFAAHDESRACIAAVEGVKP